MIQFNVAGQYLELPTDLDLQFTKSNVLFAFDDIECERTTSFEIPSTPINDKIFGMAKDYHYYGQAMRQKFAAQMQAGVVVKDGLLYIENYDNESGVYNAIFVCGEVLALKLATEKGNIGEYYQPTNTIVWEQTPDISGTLFNRHYYYVHQDGSAANERKCRPDMRIFRILQQAGAELGITITSNHPDINNLVYQPEKLYKADGSEASMGDTISLWKSLPQKTLADMLKEVAYLLGCAINANNTTISLDTLEDVWNKKELINIVGKAEMSRTFADFAQRNWVKGDVLHIEDHSEGFIRMYDVVFDEEALYNSYYINNDNLDKDNDLYKMECKTSRVLTDDLFAILKESSGNYLAFIHPSMSNYLGDYHWLNQNITTQTLCNQSTTIEVTALMTLLEYEGITPKTKLLYDGCEWVWTNIDYSNGQATLTLSKV